VVIPSANVGQLMLRADVVEAVAAGRFAVHAVCTADQGLAILTGAAAGSRDPCGAFPRDSINARVEQRLADFAERMRAFAAPKHGMRRRKRGSSE